MILDVLNTLPYDCPTCCILLMCWWVLVLFDRLSSSLGLQLGLAEFCWLLLLLTCFQVIFLYNLEFCFGSSQAGRCVLLCVGVLCFLLLVFAILYLCFDFEVVC